MSNPALIVDVGTATIAAGPTITAATAGQGSTFTVRNAALNSGVELVDAWTKAPHANTVRITSPNLVPVTNGITAKLATGLNGFVLPRDQNQQLIPQDQLSVALNGTAADVNGVALQSYYQNLPGGAMTLKMPGDIASQIDFVFGWPVAVTSSATAGNPGTAVITTTMDSSSANTWYALLGYTVDVSCLAVGLQGVDTSQLVIGGPGDPAPYRTSRYFEELSMRTGYPCVPLFNSANKGSTNIVAFDNAASTALNVTMILAQMVGNYTP